ncbi:phosphatidylserine synthase [Psychromonas sp. CNPT3]|uniref:CDP-diacylglycerol--serine O-phosphatidyltransferase n=1 Tax=Psychromonas sp. CNPT3 TaxID=314282 RepID=UPI0002C0D423|nr:CDP-diacylglycerol--serine O-phosphatidyltransferase [Psychromonas sp. CNPT3]AGH81135.1 phosphatidylserine synthase [Psychromonas sp. CNPT3]
MSNRIKQGLSYLNNLKKIPLDVQSVECLFAAKAFKHELLSQIEKAQKRIYLVALYLEADTAGAEILLALYEAKRRIPTLDVVVCIDYHRAQRGLIGEKESKSTNASWYQEVEKIHDLGIKIVGIPVKRKEIFGVQHLKGFIFDDKVLYSGASFNDIYLHQNDRYRYDRYWLLKNKTLADTMVDFLQKEILSSDATALLNAPRITPFNELKKAHKKLVRNLRQSYFHYEGEMLTDTLSVAPLCGLGVRHNALNQSIRKLLQSTQKELVLFTPYFNFPGAIARDITDLLQRGVKLTIVVGDKTANDFYIPLDKPFRTIGGLPYLYECNLKRFVTQHQARIKTQQLSINLWRHENNSFHLKGLYCDQRFILLTGHNLNPRAWRLDVENGLLIDDPKQQLKTLMDKEFAQIMANTRRIQDVDDIEGLQDYPEHVRKLLVRLRRVKADKLVKGII